MTTTTTRTAAPATLTTEDAARVARAEQKRARRAQVAAEAATVEARHEAGKMAKAEALAILRRVAAEGKRASQEARKEAACAEWRAAANPLAAALRAAGATNVRIMDIASRLQQVASELGADLSDPHQFKIVQELAAA